MIVFKLILFTLFISVSYCRTPDKVHCVNEQCDRPISRAKTLLSYTSPDPDLISFRGNSDALVFMKSAGTNSDLWYVSINGKLGFVNSKFLREQKLLEKNLVIVAYEDKPQENLVQPDKVQQPHEVIEGTTIYTTEAAVNNEQDSTTPLPLSSPDLIPSLNSATGTPNQNIDNSANQDIASQPDKVNEAPITPEIITEHSEEKQTEQPSLENPPNLSQEPSVNSAEQMVPTDQQVIQELPKELPSDQLAQQLLASSGTLNTEPIVEVPEVNAEPEQTDREQNTSMLNNNVGSAPSEQQTESTENVVNIQSNIPGVEQPMNNPVQNLEENIPSNINGVPTTHNTIISEPEPTQLPTIPPMFEPSTEQSTPPTEIPVSPPELAAAPAIPDKEPVIPNEALLLVLEPIVVSNDAPALPVLEPIVVSNEASAPPVETVNGPNEGLPPPVEPMIEHNEVPAIALPVVSNELPSSSAEVPMGEAIDTSTTTETIPPLFSQQYQPLPNQDTIPPILTESSTLVPPYQDLPPIFDPTTPVPIPDDLNQYNSAESTTPTPPENVYTSMSNEDFYTTVSEEISNPTESPTEGENTGGFFSNMYSTVADIWPTSTEAPPSIYNTDEYPTYEDDKTNTEEGFSIWKYIKSTYYSVFGISEESKALFATVGETCFTDEYCDGTSNDGSNRLLIFLLTTASSVLLFTLGYYYIDNRRQDGRLIGTINSLQRDLLFSTKECEILKEELSTTKSKLAGIEDSSFGMDDMVLSLKEEINELKATNDRLRNSLDDNEKLLRVSENTAGELQNTLSEVENTLSELLTERANSEENILELNGKIQAFEEELISVTRERDNFQLKYVSAETALEEFKKQKKQLDEVNQLLTEANNTIELKKHEITALKEAIKELKSGTPSNVDATSLIDHTEIKAKLAKVLEEKNSLAAKFECEHKERIRLTDELKVSQESLQTTNQSATEALTRLEVLGKYFQERESELLKELSTKESLWLSKQGESTSTVEKIELLQQEVQRYKEKCDALTLELAEQESSRRAALSEVEARAHSAWLEARAARRDADAARDDAAALRRKLASLSTADGAVSPHHKVVSPLENVENPVLPPPLPPMFLPPPLLPPLPRPPPLGRLPSPHPPRYGDRRYSPDSRYSPQSRYSPDSRYSPETVRYSPDSRYSPRRRSPYSPRSRRRSRSRERYTEVRVTRSRNGPADTETEYNSDSPTRQPRRRRYSRHSGPSSGSGCSSESDK